MMLVEIALRSLDLLSLFWLGSSILIALAHIFLHMEGKPTLNSIQIVTDFLKPLYYFGKLKQLHVRTGARRNRSLGPKLINTFSSFPKRWFGHFYVAGFLVHSLVFLFVVLVASKRFEVPQYLQLISLNLHCFGTHELIYQAHSLWPILVVFACEEFHLLRRIYECYFISSFSNGTISIIHYFYGLSFYVMFGFGILVSLPLHGLSFSYALDPLDAVYMCIGFTGFCVASYLQHKTMKTFAALRLKEKDEKAQGHYIPQGHLFRWVSSPHYLCEILLYLSLCCIMQWRNTYLICTTVFVLVNQASASLSVHTWYKQTFHNYPKSRKALIPLLL